MTNQIPIFIWILALISVSLSASAQLLMKVGMSAARAEVGLPGIALAAASNPFVIGGLGCYGLSAVLWLVVLTRMPLSMAYPLVALAIVLVMVGSRLLLGEALPLVRIGGGALIVLGVIAIGLKG